MKVVSKTTIRFFAFLLGFTLSLFVAASSDPERQKLPEFTLSDYQGQTVDIAQYNGKLVLVNFWASWCPPCVHEFPSIQALKTSFENEPFEILGVNMGEDAELIELFADGLGDPINFPLLVDESMSVASSWEIRGLPTTILVNKKGEEIFRFIGPKDWNSEEVREEIQRYFSE